MQPSKTLLLTKSGTVTKVWISITVLRLLTNTNMQCQNTQPFRTRKPWKRLILYFVKKLSNKSIATPCCEVSLLLAVGEDTEPDRSLVGGDLDDDGVSVSDGGGDGDDDRVGGSDVGGDDDDDFRGDENVDDVVDNDRVDESDVGGDNDDDCVDGSDVGGDDDDDRVGDVCGDVGGDDNDDRVSDGDVGGAICSVVGGADIGSDQQSSAGDTEKIDLAGIPVFSERAKGNCAKRREDACNGNPCGEARLAVL